MEVRFQCSSSRAIQWAHSVDPATVVFDGYWARGLSVRVTAGMVRTMEGRIDAELRTIVLPVDPSLLSPEARDIALSCRGCLNRVREHDLWFNTGVTRLAAECPSPEQVGVRGIEFYNQPFRTVLKWPTLRDDETTEEYFERVAKLIRLARLMFAEGIEMGRIWQAINKMSRFIGDWQPETSLPYVR